MKLTYAKGYTGRLPLCLLHCLTYAEEFFLWTFRETNIRLNLRFVTSIAKYQESIANRFHKTPFLNTLRLVCIFCDVQNTKPNFKTVSWRNHDFCIFIMWGESCSKSQRSTKFCMINKKSHNKYQQTKEVNRKHDNCYSFYFSEAKCKGPIFGPLLSELRWNIFSTISEERKARVRILDPCFLIRDEIFFPLF